MDPPYVDTVCKWSVFLGCADVLDATLTRLFLPRLPLVPTPADVAEAIGLRHRGFSSLLRARQLTHAELAEAAALRRRRLWCGAAGVAHGALALAQRRLMAPVVLLPDVARQVLAVAALGATASCLLMEVRLIEIGINASGLRRFPFARGIVAAIRTAVRVAALVGFAAAVWVPDA